LYRDKNSERLVIDVNIGVSNRQW